MSLCIPFLVSFPSNAELEVLEAQRLRAAANAAKPQSNADPLAAACERILNAREAAKLAVQEAAFSAPVVSVVERQQFNILHRPALDSLHRESLHERRRRAGLSQSPRSTQPETASGSALAPQLVAHQSPHSVVRISAERMLSFQHPPLSSSPLSRSPTACDDPTFANIYLNNVKSLCLVNAKRNEMKLITRRRVITFKGYFRYTPTISFDPCADVVRSSSHKQVFLSLHKKRGSPTFSKGGSRDSHESRAVKIVPRIPRKVGGVVKRKTQNPQFKPKTALWYNCDTSETKTSVAVASEVKVDKRSNESLLQDLTGLVEFPYLTCKRSRKFETGCDLLSKVCDYLKIFYAGHHSFYDHFRSGDSSIRISAVGEFARLYCTIGGVRKVFSIHAPRYTRYLHAFTESGDFSSFTLKQKPAEGYCYIEHLFGVNLTTGRAFPFRKAFSLGAYPKAADIFAFLSRNISDDLSRCTFKGSFVGKDFHCHQGGEYQYLTPEIIVGGSPTSSPFNKSTTHFANGKSYNLSGAALPKLPQPKQKRCYRCKDVDFKDSIVFLRYVQSYVQSYVVGAGMFYDKFRNVCGSTITVYVRDFKAVCYLQLFNGVSCATSYSADEYVTHFGEVVLGVTNLSNYRRAPKTVYGNCYLQFIFECCVGSGIAFDSSKAVKALDTLPTLKCLLQYVKSLGIPVPNYLRGFFKSRTLFHCDIDCPTIVCVDRFSGCVVIGGVEEVTPSLVQDQELLQAVSTAISRSGIGRDSILVRSVETEAIRVNEAARNERNRRPEQVIPYQLSEEKQACLVNSFPEFNLKFTHSTHSNHSLAAACRLLENSLHHKKAGGDYVDVGGCPKYHLMAGHSGVHICRPVCDLKDAQRKVLREHSITSTETLPHRLYDKVAIAGCGITACSKMMDSCDQKTKCMVATQVYDMDVDDMAKAMQKRGAKVFFFSLITPGEFLTDREAFRLNVLDVDIIKNTSEDRVTYIFGHTTYSHTLSKLLKLMQTSHFSNKGDLFSLEMYEVRCGVNFYQLTRSECCPTYSGSHLLRFPYADPGVTKVKIPRFDRQSRCCLPGADYLYLDSDFVEKIYLFTVNACQNVNTKTFEYVWNHIKNSKARLVISGKIVRRDVSLDIRDLESFAAVMLAAGVRSRLTAECFSKKISLAVNEMTVFAMIKYAISEKFRHMKFVFRRRFTDLIKKICKDAFDIDFLEANDLITSIGSHAEYVVEVSLDGNGKIGENEETDFIASQATRLVRNSLTRDVIMEARDEVIDSRAEAAEAAALKRGDGQVQRNANIGKGGLKAGATGFSFLDWLLTAMSNLIVDTPAAVRECLKEVAKSLSNLKLPSKFRKLLSVVINPFIFDDSISVTIELVGKCFSKLLSAWYSYLKGEASFRVTLAKFTLCVITDVAIGACQGEKATTLLDSQMRNIVSDYISKALVFGTSPISSDGILTLSGVLVTMFRKIVSRCMNEEKSCYAGYYNNNAVDSPLVSYIRRECRKLGVGLTGYLQQIIRDTIHELIPSLGISDFGKSMKDRISKSVNEGASWVASYLWDNTDTTSDGFFDAQDDISDAEEAFSKRPGLGGAGRAKSIIGTSVVFVCLKGMAMFRDFPTIAEELRLLSSKCKVFKLHKLGLSIDRFVDTAAEWRGSRYANVILNGGAALYYLCSFFINTVTKGVANISKWLVSKADDICRYISKCETCPKAIRTVFKGVRDIFRSIAHSHRVLTLNGDASCSLIAARVTGALSLPILVVHCKMLSLGLKACFVKKNDRVGTYVDINPKECCDGGVYYEFQSDISDDEILEDSSPTNTHSMLSRAEYSTEDQTLKVFEQHLQKNLSASSGLLGGSGSESALCCLLRFIANKGFSRVKTQLLLSLIVKLCGSSCTFIGAPALFAFVQIASKFDVFLRFARSINDEQSIIDVCNRLIILNNKFGFKFIERQLLRIQVKAGDISNNKVFKLITKLSTMLVNCSDYAAEFCLSTLRHVIRRIFSIACDNGPAKGAKRGGEPSFSEDFEFSDEEEFSKNAGLNGAGNGYSVISYVLKTVAKLLLSGRALSIVKQAAKIWVFKRSVSYATHESMVYSFAGCLFAWLSKDQIYTKVLILSTLPTKDEAFEIIQKGFNIFGGGVAIPDRVAIFVVNFLEFAYSNEIINNTRKIALKILSKFSRVTEGGVRRGVKFSPVPVVKGRSDFMEIDLKTIIDDIESQRRETKDLIHTSNYVRGDIGLSKGKEVQVETIAEHSDSDDEVVTTNVDSEKAELVQMASKLIPEIVTSSSASSSRNAMLVRRERNHAEESYQCPYLKSLNINVGTPSPYTMATGKGSTLTNSVREFYYLQEVALFEVYMKCLKYYQEANALGFDRKVLTCNEDAKMVLYDGSTRKMQFKNRTIFKSWEKVHKENGYNYCFGSDGLIPFTSPAARGKKLVLHDDIAFLPQNLFLRALSGNNFRFTNSGVKLRLYEAPPGGGKTHTLIELFVKSFRVVNSLILTANKNSQIEISGKVEKEVLRSDVNSGEACLSTTPFVSTIDSYLMHNSDRRCELLFVDECFMVHAGEVLAALELTKCKVALLFGDSRQIHYIHRGELESCRFSDLNEYIDETGRVYGDRSYRCPWDVCEWLSKQYNNKISTEKHESVGRPTCSIKLVECEDDIEVSEKVKYLTYTQEEKHKIQHHLDKRGFKTTVNTVHEVQGETYERVSLTRLKFQEDAPFSSMNHVIVALSRHTNSLVYNVLSARCTDRTSVEIERMRKICEEFRQNPYTNTTHSYSISGVVCAPDNFKSKPCSAPIEVINYWLDDVLPGCGFGDMGDPSDEMRSSPFECGVDNVVVTDAAPPECASTQQRVNYVRSQAIPKRKPSLQENLYSYESRNYNFIDSDKFSDPTLFGFCMAENFFKRCCHFDRIAELKNDIIALSDTGFRTWFEKREAPQLKALYRDMESPYDIESEITRFKLMVKADAKVKLDASSLVKHPPAQNIMFHRKVINAVYSQCFDEFKNRLIYVLKDNIKLYTEMSLETFGNLVGSMLGYSCDYEVGEVDFSKFDKSQDKFIKAFERRIYESFGFEAELLDIWMEGEYLGRARTLDGQLGFTVENQRRSGASNTWVGNSLVTLGILSLYYDVERFEALFVSGDDSLIFSRKPLKNHSEMICLETGFETKFMNPSIPYFCSKFLVFTGNRVVFVPDPYKLLVKLGAPLQDVSVSYLMALFESFKDLTGDYDDQVVIDILTELVHFKHNFSSDYTNMAICSIHCLRANFKTFRKLYPEVKGWMIVPTITKYLQNTLPAFVVERYAGVKGLSIEFESSLNSSEPHPYQNPESD
ncbi:1a/1b [Blackcurrant leafroll-associated virus 1]|uniref:1a/1b n=1 Tax=Blackcurrant leafroll-associated virus 1 TaxID=2292426 RepID=UPI000E32FE9C|nr:1a/1b [Blackcurrant leafroll-associated virus 1]AXN56975.1 1a/1b [Blackcurrant leafroll-associated virus 1]